MKIEGLLFAAGTVWFFVLAGVYWFMAQEPAGTTALALTGGLAAIIGFYVLFTGRRIDPRPEDRTDADIDEGAGDYGFFSPHSWWPLPTAFFASVTALGLVFGWWLVLLGVSGLGFAVLGLVFEYYRPSHSH